MVYIGGDNLSDSINGLIGKINPTWLRAMGMFLMVISVICVVMIVMDIMKRRQNVTVSTFFNGLLYISAFVAGWKLWAPKITA